MVLVWGPEVHHRNNKPPPLTCVPLPASANTTSHHEQSVLHTDELNWRKCDGNGQDAFLRILRATQKFEIEVEGGYKSIHLRDSMDCLSLLHLVYFLTTCSSEGRIGSGLYRLYYPLQKRCFYSTRTEACFVCRRLSSGVGIFLLLGEM